MCNQTGSLVAAEVERAGIPTVGQIYLRVAAEHLRPPRMLLVPFDHGHALGEPGNAELQLDVLRRTFALLDEPGPPPVLREYTRRPAEAGARRG